MSTIWVATFRVSKYYVVIIRAMFCCLGNGVELQNGILWLWELCVHCSTHTNLCHALGFTRLAWLIEVCSVAHKEHNRCIRHNKLIKLHLRNFIFLCRWGTSLTCATCAQCQQMRRRLLLRRTTSVSLRRRPWTLPTWRRPSIIFSQVILGFLLPSTAFPILSLPLTKNTMSLLWVATNQIDRTNSA